MYIVSKTNLLAQEGTFIEFNFKRIKEFVLVNCIAILEILSGFFDDLVQV